MIQVPKLKVRDISTILKDAESRRSEFRRIAEIHPANDFIDPNHLNETIIKSKDCGIRVERKAYTLFSIIDNYGLDSKVKIVEERYSQGFEWASGYINYYSYPLIYPNSIQAIIPSEDCLHACNMARDLIKRYLQCGNVKANLFAQGIVHDQIINIRQLIVFELAHPLESNDPSQNCLELLPRHFTPIKIPFRN